MPQIPLPPDGSLRAHACPRACSCCCAVNQSTFGHEAVAQRACLPSCRDCRSIQLAPSCRLLCGRSCGGGGWSRCRGAPAPLCTTTSSPMRSARWGAGRGQWRQGKGWRQSGVGRAVGASHVGAYPARTPIGGPAHCVRLQQHPPACRPLFCAAAPEEPGSGAPGQVDGGGQPERQERGQQGALCCAALRCAGRGCSHRKHWASCSPSS